MAGMKDQTLQPKGYQQINGLAAATSLTVPAGATRALIKTEAQSVRWRDDAVDPTAAIGMLIDVGDEFWYTGQLRSFRAIQTAATAVLNISYYA